MSKEVYLIAHREKEFKVTRFIKPYVKQPDFYKIGIAEDPEKRLSGMKSSTPHVLELVTAIEAEDAKGVEKLLHDLHIDWHQKGEWYRLMRNSVNSLIAFDSLCVGELEQVKSNRYEHGRDMDLSLYCEVMGVRNDE